jgi:uncharacterized protein
MPKAVRYIGILFIAFVFLSAIFGSLIDAFVDYYFFSSLNVASVFWTYLTTQYIVQIVFFILFILIAGVNVVFAYRSSSYVNRALDIGQLGVSLSVIRWIFLLFLLLIGWFISMYPASNWLPVLMYLQQSPFGSTDPVFGRDISFYVFSIPVYEMVRNFLMATLVVSLLATAVVYFFREGILVAPQAVHVSSKVKSHAALLIAFFFAIQIFDYWLSRYELMFSAGGIVYGMTYIDENIRVFSYNVMMVVCLAGIALAILGFFRRNLKQPTIGLGLLIVFAIIMNGIVPGFVQRFSVDPNELERERPYLDNHIQSTRDAYGLNEIIEKQYPVDYSLSNRDLQENRLTIENIPLWDYRPLLETYQQIQAIRPYYEFNDIDIARYNFDGDYRQIMLAPRELDQRRLSGDSQTWVNKTFIYTHGYGVVANPVNVFTEEGLPELFIRDIPPRMTIDIDLDRPEIYFGERTNEPIIVRASIQEFDYPYGETNVFTTYSEETGVNIGSKFRQLIFAIHFGSINYLITQYIQPESQIVYYRNIHERVRKLAPFLSFDHDPYITIVDGRLYWIYDAYTTTARYPYSRPYSRNINYMRNSVKVVIDAYNGETKFYIIDEDRDPLIRAYLRVFPDLFVPIEEMDQGLRDQIRYPQDLFDVQASMFRLYHMQDAVMFYNREDVWEFPRERVFGASQIMESYYTILRLPEETIEEFMLMIPFTPVNRDNMIAWLSGRSDGENYGKLLLFRFPRGELIFGPMQIEARIDQTTEIAQQLALWDQAGTRVLRGSQLVIPVANSILYVKPLFLRAVEGRLPELRRVLASDGNRVVMEIGLDVSLQRLVSDRPIPVADLPVDVPPELIDRIITPTRDVQELAREALAIYERAQDFLRQGNLARYEEELKALRSYLQRIIDQGTVPVPPGSSID